MLLLHIFQLSMFGRLHDNTHYNCDGSKNYAINLLSCLNEDFSTLAIFLKKFCPESCFCIYLPKAGFQLTLTCSNLTIETLEKGLQHILQLLLVFLLLNLNR